ncbi:hypothetical protein [Streptomyces sp. NPDC057939]
MTSALCAPALPAALAGPVILRLRRRPDLVTGCCSRSSRTD